MTSGHQRRGREIEGAILHALASGPKTCPELMVLTRASQSGVRNALLRLAAAHRITPVLGWVDGDRRFPARGWARVQTPTSPPAGDRRAHV